MLCRIRFDKLFMKRAIATRIRNPKCECPKFVLCFSVCLILCFGQKQFFLYRFSFSIFIGLVFAVICFLSFEYSPWRSSSVFGFVVIFIFESRKQDLNGFISLFSFLLLSLFSSCLPSLIDNLTYECMCIKGPLNWYLYDNILKKNPNTLSSLSMSCSHYNLNFLFRYLSVCCVSHLHSILISLFSSQQRPETKLLDHFFFRFSLL